MPKSSYLGPLLFLVYTNDLPKVIENCTVAMYAGASAAQLNGTINKSLEIHDYWLKGDKLSLNAAKTVSINVL